MQMSCSSTCLCAYCRWDQAMDVPPGIAASEVGVGQWRPGLDFGQFSELTVQHYYRNGEPT